MTREKSSHRLSKSSTLLALGKQFEPLSADFWDKIDQAKISDPMGDNEQLGQEIANALDQMQPTLRKIIRMRADTDDGIMVKLHTLSHCLGCEDETLDQLISGESSYPGLLLSIARDLMRKHGIEPRQSR